MPDNHVRPFKSKLYCTEMGDFSVIHAKTIDPLSISEHDTPYLFLTNYIGVGSYHINKRSTTVHPGAFYFLNEGDKLAINFDQQEYRETVILQFCHLFMKNILQSLIRSNSDLLDSPDLIKDKRLSIPTIPFELTSEIQASLSPLLCLDDNIEIDKIYFMLERFGLVYKESLEQFRRIGSIKKTTKEEIYKRCFLAEEYIKANFHESPTLDQMAKVAMMNKFHFLNQFKKMYGLTPKQYIINLQMEKSHTMIISGKYSITEVMEKVGYESLPSFSLLFKKYFGVSPTKIFKC